MQNGILYDSICSQKTPKKNSRNASNISMKKYHHNPEFGVKSGIVSGVIYTESRNCQDGSNMRDTTSRKPEKVKKVLTSTTANVEIGGSSSLLQAIFVTLPWPEVPSSVMVALPANCTHSWS